MFGIYFSIKELLIILFKDEIVSFDMFPHVRHYPIYGI